MTADRVVIIATPPPSTATAAVEKDVLLPPPPGDGSSALARHLRKTGGPFLFDLPPALSDSRADLSLCGCRGNKAGLSPPPARYIPAVLMSEPPFKTRMDAAPPTRTLGRVTRSLLFYNTGDIDLLFMTLRFLKYLQGRHCVPPRESRRRRHAAVDFMLMIGSQGACHHGDWHASLRMFDVHVQHTQLAAGSRVEGTPGSNALTKGARPQQHDGEAEENRYI